VTDVAERPRSGNAPGEDVEAGVSDEPAAEAPRRGRTALIVLGLTAIVGGIPAVVALWVLRKPHWYPLLDLAQTELRLRDFENGHPPLIGLASRVEALGKRGSHLGPAEFWAMYPFYKLYGSSAWAVQAAGATVNLIAMGIAIWIGHRRAQLRGALGVALVVAVLGHTYGAEKLVSEHWIPHTPLMWWIVFLLAVWSVACDDLPMLPIAVFAGSFCVQTHIPYLGLVLGLLGLLALAVVVQTFRRRGSEERGLRRVLLWGLPSLVLLGVLWAPTIVEQLTTEPGNISVMRESLSNPPENDKAVGFGSEAVETWLGHLNAWKLFTWDLEAHETDVNATRGSPVPAIALLAVWALAALLAVRSRQRNLVRLHAVVGAATVLGLVSIASITGILWYYLVLWAWGTTALMLGVTLWTFASLVPAERLRLSPAVPTVGLAALVVVAAGFYTEKAAHTEVPNARESRVVAHLAPATIEALDRGDIPGTGPDGRYMVEFLSDAAGIGEQGFGLLLELERQGFDVGVPDGPTGVVTGAVPHRARSVDEVTAAIHYAVGERNIQRWRDLPGSYEVAYYDVRTPEQKREYDRLFEEVQTGMRDLGLDEEADGLGGSLIVAALNPEVPERLDVKIQRMMEIGLPAAVFVTRPDAQLPFEAP
jgi:hypothetical protein